MAEDESGGLALEKCRDLTRTHIEENNNPKAWAQERPQALLENRLPVLTALIMEAEVFPEASESSVPSGELSPAIPDQSRRHPTLAYFGTEKRGFPLSGMAPGVMWDADARGPSRRFRL